MCLAQTAQHLAAVELREDDIEKDGIGILVRNAPQCFLAIAGFDNGMPAVEELRLEFDAHKARVVNNQYLHF